MKLFLISVLFFIALNSTLIFSQGTQANLEASWNMMKVDLESKISSDNELKEKLSPTSYEMFSSILETNAKKLLDDPRPAEHIKGGTGRLVDFVSGIYIGEEDLLELVSEMVSQHNLKLISLLEAENQITFPEGTHKGVSLEYLLRESLKMSDDYTTLPSDSEQDSQYNETVEGYIYFGQFSQMGFFPSKTGEPYWFFGASLVLFD